MRGLNAVVIMVLLAAGACYIPVAAQFFSYSSRFLGQDYEYFLPLALAGKYWIVQNGVFAIPYFSPAFCGGLPFLANPQSIFYSAPQLFSLIVDPVQAFLATTVISAWLGGLGAFLLMRQRFETSLPASGLTAVIFMFNTFLLHRMAIGHVTYHVIGLVPLLCHWLLTPVQWSADRRRAISRVMGAMTGSAAILAYVVYAGAANTAVPIALTAAVVWLLHALVRQPAPSFWLLAPGAAVLGSALAAMKLAPSFVFIDEFPRPESLKLLFPDAIRALRGLYYGLFWPSAIPNIGLLKHELDYGVGLVPMVMILAGLAVFFRRGTWRRWPGSAGCLKLGALGLGLFLPLWLNCGGSHFAAWLKTLPFVGENRILVRWFLIYILPVSLGTGLILDYLAGRAEVRSIVAIAGIVSTVSMALIADQSYYLRQRYDSSPVVAADRELREYGRVPVIVGIGGSGPSRRNDALVEGLSAFPCYEPLFGYHLQIFPRVFRTGSVLSDPVCYLYGRENGCRPGDPFRRSAAEDAAAFAAYRQFSFVLPSWQSYANSITLAAAAVTMLAVVAAFWGRWHDRRQRLCERRSKPARQPYRVLETASLQERIAMGNDGEYPPSGRTGETS